MKKIVVWVGGLTLLVITGVVFYIAYLGFVPGLSSLIGANNPRDLGVSYSQTDAFDYLDRAGTTVVGEMMADTTAKIQFTGTNEVKADFSQEEISAALNYFEWNNMPVKNTQLRINPDGTVEFSGNLQIDRIVGFLANTGLNVSQNEIEQAMKYVGYVKTNLPVYAKFAASVTKNQATVDMQSFQIGRINIPLEAYNVDKVITSATNIIISQVTGLNAESVTFSDRLMSFKGTVPTTMTVPYAVKQ